MSAVRKRTIVPVKRRSDYQHRIDSGDYIKTEHTKTPFGFVEPGAVGKIETSTITIHAGASTGTAKHLTKTRVYKVLRGSCAVTTSTEDGKSETRTIKVGDEFVAEPKVAYSLMALGTSAILYVVQESKYEARVESDLPKIVAQEPKPVTARRRGSSKAKEQQMRKNAAAQGGVNWSAVVEEGINAKPSVLSPVG